MTFYQRLRMAVGQQVQLYLPVDTVIGTLIDTDMAITTVRTNAVPGYVAPQDVSVVTSQIAYVRYSGVA